MRALKKNTPLSALRSIADKKFLRVVSQCVYNLIQSYTTYCSSHIYIKCFAHCLFSAHCKRFSKASKLDGDDEHGMSRVVQEKEAYRSKFGWKAANEYEEDESASDSADEKYVFRSERRVERQVGASQKKQRDNCMNRNAARRYAHSYILHENPGHKLLQGWKKLSEGRGLRQQNRGPCSNISTSFQLTLFNPPLTFNRCNRHNKNLLQEQKMLYFVVSFPRTFLLKAEYPLICVTKYSR